MQRASAAFGLLIFVLWLAVLAVGLAYVTVWAATRRRPQWQVLRWLSAKAADPKPGPQGLRHTAEIIPFDPSAAVRRRKRA